MDTPVMKLPDNFANTMDEERQKEQTPEDEKEGDDKEIQKNSQENQEEETVTGKREKMDDSEN